MTCIRIYKVMMNYRIIKSHVLTTKHYAQIIGKMWILMTSVIFGTQNYVKRHLVEYYN
jgi:hypothetical protein